MIPQDNTNRTELNQFLQSGKPPVQPDQPEAANGPTRQNIPPFQPPTTDKHFSQGAQGYEQGFPPAPFYPGVQYGQPWPSASPDSQPVSSVQTGPQPPSSFRQFAPRQRNVAPFQPLAPGEPGTPWFPVTGKQQTPPFSPQETGRQEAISFLPYETGRQGVPPTGYRVPPAPTSSGLLSRYAANKLSTGQQSIPSMPSMPSIPATQQYATANWPAVDTDPRPSTMPGPSPQKYTPTRPLPPKKPARKKGPALLAAVVCLLMAAAVVVLSQNGWFLFHSKQLARTQSHSQVTPTSATPALNSITNNTEISPFLFGTNMALFHDNDEPILNSAATRQQLKNIGVRIIRMPTRTTLSLQTEIAAATDIKEIGASALVVIHGPEFKDGPLYNADQQIIRAMTGVFGNQPVYFEFGNESDLNGINADQYTQQWNQVIPLLKKQFPTARFIGPDNFQFTRRYLKTFLQQANPLPDGISWHEYTCSVNWTAAFCLANLDSWPIHFAQARAAMQEAIGKTLPIWITEWNYTSDQEVINGQPINDGKYNNPAFIQSWTTKAMQLLISNRIFASMQYFATNQPMPLVFNGQIGSEGTIFQHMYQSVMVDKKTPAAAYYQGPPPPIPDPNAQYTFENGGTAGWYAIGQGITPPVNTTARAVDGTHSLMFTLQNVSEDNTATVLAPASTTASPPQAGQMITVYIYVANKDALVNAKIFVADTANSWQFASSITLTSGAWNKVWYSLPMNFTHMIGQFGIQFFTSHPGVATDVYVDDFGWK